MNYRHIYHAGNFADVFKHIVLMLALEHLRLKDKPFFVLDTHAGIGLYDLKSEAAGKTKESDEGIGRLWEQTDAPEEVKRYLDLVRRFNKGKALRFYPGSPLIVREMLRTYDRFTGGELHPEDAPALRKNLGKDYRIKVEHEDGYRLIKSLLPPHERRGLVLIDPPFEVEDEFGRMKQALADGYKRWATGTYILWYPVKEMKQIETFHKALAGMDIPRIAAFDFMLRPPDDPERLNGCGVAVVNPPWTLAGYMGKISPWLAGILTGGRGSYGIKQISGES